MNTNMLIIVFSVITAILFVVSVFLVVWVVLAHRKLKVFFSGSTGTDLESHIMDIARKVAHMEEKQQWSEENIIRLSEQFKGAVQHVGIVRFNPFGGEGGDQSFVIALLDEYRTGVVLSSFYSREGVRVYAKPITQEKSPYPLTEEEEQAIQKAIG